MPKLMFDSSTTREFTNDSLEFIADTLISALATIEGYYGSMIIGEFFMDGGVPYIKLMDTDYNPIYVFHGRHDRVHYNILEKALETGEIAKLLGIKK